MLIILVKKREMKFYEVYIFLRISEKNNNNNKPNPVRVVVPFPESKRL